MRDLEIMDAQRALEQGRQLPYALVRSLSDVTLGPTPAAVDTAQLLEARFFSPEEEIRVFRGETGLQAVRLTAEDGDCVLKSQDHPLSNAKFGKKVTVCRHLAFDEDGQAYVWAARLTGWEGDEA